MIFHYAAFDLHKIIIFFFSFSLHCCFIVSFSFGPDRNCRIGRVFFVFPSIHKWWSNYVLDPEKKATMLLIECISFVRNQPIKNMPEIIIEIFSIDNNNKTRWLPSAKEVENVKQRDFILWNLLKSNNIVFRFFCFPNCDT